MTPPHQEQRCGGYFIGPNAPDAGPCPGCPDCTPSAFGPDRNELVPDLHIRSAEVAPNPPPSDPHEGDWPWPAQQEWEYLDDGRFYAASSGDPRTWWLADHGRYDRYLIASGLSEDDARALASFLNRAAQLQAAHRADLSRVQSTIDGVLEVLGTGECRQPDCEGCEYERTDAVATLRSLIQSLSTKDTEDGSADEREEQWGFRPGSRARSSA